nr:uncharacterized protein CTRU02_00808 [Colletotrichum truncatum]KAF6800403.1 hypothetical protein CTRU02_00808 [Colletotrichum truncatum]
MPRDTYQRLLFGPWWSGSSLSSRRRVSLRPKQQFVPCFKPPRSRDQGYRQSPGGPTAARLCHPITASSSETLRTNVRTDDLFRERACLGPVGHKNLFSATKPVRSRRD